VPELPQRLRLDLADPLVGDDELDYLTAPVDAGREP
jgi:hypothetical protein